MEANPNAPYLRSKYEAPIGEITLVTDSTGEHLVGLALNGQKQFGGPIRDETVESSKSNALRSAHEWLDQYFVGERPSVSDLSLQPQGTPFRKIVWSILLEIPYGETTTYGEIASEAAAIMGKPKMSAQAVGGAVGHNPISIIIPCHRVIGADGSLTGYGGGLDLKVKLLELEGLMTNPFL